MTTTATIYKPLSLSSFATRNSVGSPHIFYFEDTNNRMTHSTHTSFTKETHALGEKRTNASSDVECLESELCADTHDGTDEILDGSETVKNQAIAISSPLFNTKDSTRFPAVFPISSNCIKHEQTAHIISTASSNGSRRSIFAESCFQQHRPTQNSSQKSLEFATGSKDRNQLTPTNPRSVFSASRPRAMTDPSSRRLPEYMKVHGVSRHEVTEFLRPYNCRYHPDHLKGIEEHPDLHTKLGLPDLPSPLQRMRKSSGVYPLLSPRSILHRRPKKIIATDGATRVSNHMNSQTLAETLTQVMAGSDGAKSTIYPSLHSTTMKVSETSTTSTESLDSKTTGSGASRDTTVRFDPRLTVTEYDDNIERKWYTEAELREFQSNTVLLVKQYLMNNPAALVEYNTPRLDPVTGALRRKALFSIPILGIEGGRDEFFTKVTEMDRSLPDFVVKSILIVDRNQLILDLFRRSLQILFPKASIATSESGDEARSIIQSKLLDCSSNGTSPQSFDIIIAEERLYIPLQRSPAITLIRKDSNTSTAKTNDPKSVRCSKHVRVQSFNAVGRNLTPSPPQSWNGISGSELFQHIQDMERAAFFTSTTAPTFDLLEEVPAPHCSLLIGVSTNPNQDSRRFLEHGADFVWGKPPPCMNAALRNELITALIKKRRKRAKISCNG
jgi:CheY-like chemotaxis protein